MGRMLLSGELVAVNKKRALEYFLMASDLGNIQTKHEYANMLMSDNGPETDYEKAGDYFKTAAFYGNVSSMRNYGLMLKNGKLPSDFKKSAYYLEKAAKLGDHDAMYHYGNLLCVMALLGNCSNKKEIQKNYEIAANYYKIAADEGHIDACVKYGIMYTRGLLNSDDIELPIFYLKKAAYNDNSDGIREYLSAMNNVPFEYITERYSKYSIYFVMERTRLIRKLRKAGINPLRDLAIISGIRLNPLSSFIQNDNYIEENEYDYEYEEIVDPKTKKKIKIPNRNIGWSISNRNLDG